MLIYEYSKIENRSGFSLIELSAVMVILGIIAAVSYPAMVSSYNHGRVDSTCFEIISSLKLARGLSATASDNRVYGVIFKPDGEYGIYGFPSDTLINLSNYNNSAIVKPYAEKMFVDTSLAIANFQAVPQPFWVIFRDDGVPTADGVSMPIPDSAALIKIVSTAVNYEAVIKISKSTGIAEVK